jgi:RNA polymerase sigma-70 factor (ECF subfamily)
MRAQPAPDGGLGARRLSRTGSSWYPGCVVRAVGDATFPERVLSHLHALHGFAFRLSQSAAEAEDLVQDTFTRALAAAEQFRPGSNLRAWLFRILRNAYIDGRRRDRRAPLSADGRVPEPSSDVATELLRGDIEIDCLRRLVAEQIEAALFALSDEARSVILLDLEGFSEQEVADVMGCAPGTVKSRLARARAALRVKLAEYAP